MRIKIYNALYILFLLTGLGLVIVWNLTSKTIIISFLCFLSGAFAEIADRG